MQCKMALSNLWDGIYLVTKYFLDILYKYNILKKFPANIIFTIVLYITCYKIIR